MTKRNALISVYHKEGIVEFAQELVALNFKIWSSGGTAATLKAAGVPVTDVAKLVGGGAILGHRVVTLSREVHAGLLAQATPEDLAELKGLKIPFMDLVCVDCYPLEEEILSGNATTQSVIEKTDIGGPTMISAGAKGRRLVVCDPEDRSRVVRWLKAGEPGPAIMRGELAAKADFFVSQYRLLTAQYHSAWEYDGLLGKRVLQAKYGENAWQSPAALYSVGSNDPLALDKFSVVAGAAPSYNNLIDVDRLLQTVTHIAAGFEVNFGKVPLMAVAVKHGNACGAAVGDDAATVLKKMITGDLRAIHGGLVMTNFPIDEELAELLLRYKHKVAPGSKRRLLDGIIAPKFTKGAIEQLARKGDKCRFITNPVLAKLGKDSLARGTRYRAVREGFLTQPNYDFVIDKRDPEIVVTGLRMTLNQWKDAVLAWAIGSTSNSNTITLVRRGQLLANAVGQQDRVGACELALKRAYDSGHGSGDPILIRDKETKKKRVMYYVNGAVAYSDSFFPFPDGPQVLISAGISAIVATTGSVNDKLVQDTCKRAKVKLWQLPDAKARGFYNH